MSNLEVLDGVRSAGASEHRLARRERTVSDHSLLTRQFITSYSYSHDIKSITVDDHFRAYAAE